MYLKHACVLWSLFLYMKWICSFAKTLTSGHVIKWWHNSWLTDSVISYICKKCAWHWLTHESLRCFTWKGGMLFIYHFMESSCFKGNEDVHSPSSAAWTLQGLIFVLRILYLLPTSSGTLTHTRLMHNNDCEALKLICLSWYCACEIACYLYIVLSLLWTFACLLQ